MTFTWFEENLAELAKTTLGKDIQRIEDWKILIIEEEDALSWNGKTELEEDPQALQIGEKVILIVPILEFTVR